MGMQILSRLALLILLAAPALATAAPPNLVVFLSDDHTITDSGLYGDGDVKTPNLDRLAKDALTFDRAFVASPSCAPSRNALFTGLMPVRNGSEANHSQIRDGVKKLPAYLKELGYEVVAFGKVGHYKQTADHGFDHTEHLGYHDDVAVPEALKWLRARRSDKPLAFFVGTNWPHVPWPEGMAGYDPAKIKVPATHVDTPETRAARARYYAAVTRMDKELGLTYDAAREVLGANTVFLHSSDHGAQWPFGKWSCYDAGIRTPLLVAWPGVVKAGARTQAMVSWVDILPTLVDIAGGKAPADLDGRSFLPVLRGSAETHHERIYATHSGDGKMNCYPIRAVRDQRWKLILNLHPEFIFTTHVDLAQKDTGYFASWDQAAAQNAGAAALVKRYRQRPALELYDLESDPAEMKNLADEPAQAERLKAMRADLEAWMQSQGDQRTVFGPPHLTPGS